VTGPQQAQAPIPEARCRHSIGGDDQAFADRAAETAERRRRHGRGSLPHGEHDETPLAAEAASPACTVQPAASGHVEVVADQRSRLGGAECCLEDQKGGVAEVPAGVTGRGHRSVTAAITEAAEL
jgi:hypothetical protein